MNKTYERMAELIYEELLVAEGRTTGGSTGSGRSGILSTHKDPHRIMHGAEPTGERVGRAVSRANSLTIPGQVGYIRGPRPAASDADTDKASRTPEDRGHAIGQRIADRHQRGRTADIVNRALSGFPKPQTRKAATRRAKAVWPGAVAAGEGAATKAGARYEAGLERGGIKFRKPSKDAPPEGI